MSNIFVVADLHFGHEGVTKFLRNDGTKLRPWSCASEMDEAMVELWNERVHPNDKVYVLGDVVINKKHLPALGRLNGKKKLIYGNHDIFKVSQYQQYFYDLAAYKVMKDIILSHIPIHPDSVVRFKNNVHGHLHSNIIDDPRYLCCSVEQIGFAPISLEEVKEKLELNKELFTTYGTLHK
jgi:calcineurin-like phosphoesterase family protein